MPSVVLETAGACARLKSARLCVELPSESDDVSRPTTEIPLDEIESLVLAVHCQITTQAMAALLKRGTPIHLVDGHGRAIGSTYPPSTAEAGLRLLQYRRSADPEFCLPIARALVAAKIANGRRIVQKLNANRPGRVARTKLPVLARMKENAEQAEDLRALRGIEGTSARRYFSLWSRFLPEDFPFERRSARPPLNPVNACISFAAVVVYREIESALWRRGLDPALGCMHATEDGRAALALDLIEPFRPALVEALPHYLFGRGILAAGDFEERGRGIYLNRGGRDKFMLHYERRVERRFLHRRSGERTTLRALFETQALSFKAALRGGAGAFEPFCIQ